MSSGRPVGAVCASSPTPPQPCSGLCHARQGYALVAFWSRFALTARFKARGTTTLSPMALMVIMTLALCPVAAWLGSRRARWASLLAAWPLLMTVLLVRGLRSALAGHVQEDRLEWI